MLQIIFKAIQSVVGRSREEQEPGTRPTRLNLELSPIHTLPPELLLVIVDFLSVEIGISLSLTCHSIYDCLGGRCLEALRFAGSLSLSQFLHLMERDLPNHIFCPHCIQLHSIDFAERHYLPYSANAESNQSSLPCGLADHSSGLKRGIYVEFSSNIFRMAMKSHRQGNESTKLLNMLSYGTKTHIDWGFVEQRTATIRIQDGSLLIREQRVFLVSSSQKMPLPWCGSIDICPHIYFLAMSSLLRRGISIPHADEIKGYENQQGLISCDYCSTEFRVDFKSYGEMGNAMFVTRWMDVGEGRDPSDHKFTSRFGNPYKTSWEPVDFERGSICSAFEQTPDSAFKFDSLLKGQNEKILCNENRWPWPEGTDGLLAYTEQLYAVKNGRFLLK